MELRPLASNYNLKSHSPTLCCRPKLSCAKPTKELPEQVIFQSKISRRIAAMATLTAIIVSTKEETASGLESEEITAQEAEIGVRSHAQSLLEVKGLLQAQSWREAQKELRKSSAMLKQDIYAIIQSKPGSERPQLRKLYSILFNNVSKLDYAARDNDGLRVWEYYKNIVDALDDILSRI